MPIRLSELCLGTVITLALAAPAFAGPALDEEKQPEAATADPSAPAATAATATVTDGDVEYGVGIRLRNVRVPAAILELFLERAAGGASNFGYGLELTRRRGTVEIQLGVEFEHLTVGEGVWINRDEPVDQGYEADFVLAPEHAPNSSALGWFTIEFSFFNHAVINKHFAVRYGGGAGLGIITGDLYRYNVVCVGATNNNPEPGCRPGYNGFNGNAMPSPDGGAVAEKYSLPPVFPVVNAIVGLQIKPVDKMVINIEGGIRTAPFFGTTIGYFF
jgi:hypothetical protein